MYTYIHTYIHAPSGDVPAWPVPREPARSICKLRISESKFLKHRIAISQTINTNLANYPTISQSRKLSNTNRANYRTNTESTS